MTLSELYFLKIISLCSPSLHWIRGGLCHHRKQQKKWCMISKPKSKSCLAASALAVWGSHSGGASHSVGGATQEAHVKRSTLRHPTKNWHQLARHVHVPPWKWTFQPHLSLQMTTAQLTSWLQSRDPELELPDQLDPKFLTHCGKRRETRNNYCCV